MQAFLKPVRHLPSYFNLANFAFWPKMHKVVRKIPTFFFLKKSRGIWPKVVGEQSCVVAWWYICNIFQTHWEPLVFTRSKNVLKGAAFTLRRHLVIEICSRDHLIE